MWGLESGGTTHTNLAYYGQCFQTQQTRVWRRVTESIFSKHGVTATQEGPSKQWSRVFTDTRLWLLPAGVKAEHNYNSTDVRQ